LALFVDLKNVFRSEIHSVVQQHVPNIIRFLAGPELFEGLIQIENTVFYFYSRNQQITYANLLKFLYLEVVSYPKGALEGLIGYLN
jgi:hypothetical protein